MILPHGPLWNRVENLRCALQKTTAQVGAMMRMSCPQPVSLDKGLRRTGIRSHTAENDTLPYPCDAEIRHRMSEDLERSGYIFHMLGKEISSRGESMEMYVDHQLHLVSIWLPNDEKDVAILEPVYRKYKGTPYRVAVFRSGKGNLLTNTAALLKANR